MLGPRDPINVGSTLNQKSNGVKAETATAHDGRPLSTTPKSAEAQTRPELRKRLLDAALDRGKETILDVLSDAAPDGPSAAFVLSDLVPWVAYEMGRLWHDDEVSFLDVTLGSGKLQRAVHDFGLTSQHVADTEPGRVLVTTLPGEQHVLGAVIGCRLLELEGCDALLDIRGNRDVDPRAAAGFDLVTISVTREGETQGLAKMIEALRAGSGRQHLPVLLVGRSASEALAERVGADGMVDDVAGTLDVLDAGRA